MPFTKKINRDKVMEIWRTKKRLFLIHEKLKSKLGFPKLGIIRNNNAITTENININNNSNYTYRVIIMKISKSQQLIATECYLQYIILIPVK